MKKAARIDPKKSFVFAVLAGILLFSGTYGLSFAQQFNLPVVQTDAATNIFQTSATLNGEVNPNGYATTYFFEYGPSYSLGFTTPQQPVGSGYSNSFVSFPLAGLSANTYYFFRIAAQNQFGIARGSLQTFTTGNYYSYGSSGGAPSVTTNAATDIFESSATLHAYADTNDFQSVAWFEYGTDSNYLANTTPASVIAARNYYQTSNNSPFFSYQLSNLSPGTTYYFRAALRNSNSVSYGQMLSFATSGGYSGFVSPTYPTYTYQYPYSTNYYQTPANYGYNYQSQSSPYYNYYPYYSSSPSSYPTYSYSGTGYYGYPAYYQTPAYTYQPQNYSYSEPQSGNSQAGTAQNSKPASQPVAAAPQNNAVADGNYNYFQGNQAANLAASVGNAGGESGAWRALVGFILFLIVIYLFFLAARGKSA